MKRYLDDVTAEDLRERVNLAERENDEYRRHADTMEAMWALRDDAFSTAEPHTSSSEERIVLPTPYNTITLAERMFSNLPRIRVPSAKGEEDDDKKAKGRERWLTAFWQRANREFERPVLGGLVWQSLTLGRHALEARWIHDELPKARRNRRLPIMLRPLDPRHTYVEEDWRGTHFAAHCYQERWRSAYAFYREYATIPKPQTEQEADLWIDMSQVWFLDDEGNVCSAVLVDTPLCDEKGQRTGAYEHHFAKPPCITDYPEIPIVLGYGDSAPIDNRMLRGVSLLYPQYEMWKYNNRLASGIGTFLLWYFNPVIFMENNGGAIVPDEITVNPGDTTVLPQGVKPNPMAMPANIGIMQAQMSMVETNIQQGAFPSVMYGEAGGLTAGYPMQLLSQQARGRTNKIRQNLERTIEKVNGIVLSEIETFGGEEGVNIWAEDTRSRTLYRIGLKASDIEACYDNMVTLVPDVPEDNAQKIATWLRMVETGILSRQTFRDVALDTVGIPVDEDTRVMLEQALQMPEMQQKAFLKAIQEYYGRKWEEVVAATPLEQLAQMVEQWKAQREEARKQARLERATQRFSETGVVPDGFHLMPDGTLMSDKDMQSTASGNGIAASMRPPLAPSMGASPIPATMDGLPMGMGTPPDTTGAMQVPGMMGMTPEMAGQMQPEGMGLPPNLEGADPLLFQQLIGGRMGPRDELNQMMGV